MKYKYKYKNSTADFWQLSMYFIYGSMIGICNTIFTAAMILLAIRIWSDVSSFVRMLLALSIFLFPIFQPLGIYIRARKQAAASREIEISFDDGGIRVKSDQTISDLDWKSIKKVSKKPNMLVIFSTTTRGFILTNKVLGRQNNEFYHYLVSKMNH
ncbi:YcxB-like protein [Lachnotalea glycerini]|uniref:YcxB-like protein n=1 Tax=Lachnotalea glycerini TaxID=1763509 RepID=A0A318ETQ6_9FIRM|nr:YcxB family protein [Lachnotalea glycerini]PXV91638.1 YcxB-like protein [Lachnotalea glycerini]